MVLLRKSIPQSRNLKAAAELNVMQSEKNITMIDAKEFFKQSDLLDRLVLRQLDHINGNWELTWDNELEEYEPEEESYASEVNFLIEELSQVIPPEKYHENEDRLAEYVVKKLKWKIYKIGNRWEGSDYPIILEQGAFDDIDQQELIFAAAGRIKAALSRNQLHFDEMESSHQTMLANVLAIILYHRSNA